MKRTVVGRICLWGIIAVAVACGSGCPRSMSGATTLVLPTPVARAVAARSPLQAAPPGVTAFVDVNVVPMDANRVLLHHTVVVEGGWVTALGPVGQVEVPAGATRIDGTGKYLTPGLADMHVHLARDARKFDLRMIRYLASGITTVRNMDHVDANSDTVLWLRRKVAAGEILGPRIYTSGNLGLYQQPLKEIAPRVERYKARGYDFIKVYSWDTTAIFDSIVVAARRVGIPFAGHVPGGVSVRQALAAGIRSIEHNMGYYESGLGDIEPKPEPGVATEAGIAALAAATKSAGTWNSPTAFSSYPSRARAVKALHAAGAGLLLGTDLPDPELLPQFLAGFMTVGLTPYEALLTTTRNVAEYFGTLPETGTVAVGKRADLVLLRGNPLDDIWHTIYPAGVMVAGRWLPSEELDRLRIAIDGSRPSAPYARYWRSIGSSAAAVVKAAGLNNESKRVGENERVKLADSLGWDARSKAGHQRLYALLARQLGEIRATLTPTDQAVFDQEARGWLAQRERDGYRVEVSGLQR